MKQKVQVAAMTMLYLAGLGCSERARPGSGIGSVTRGVFGSSDEPDVLPQMLNEELPFRYPAPLYERRVEGNVMLRLVVDTSGSVVDDSTRVIEPSGYPGLDSAALAGARRLRFRPASRRGVPIVVSMLYPVHFRHPEGERNRSP